MSHTDDIHLELADKVMIADHERRIRFLEAMDKWSLRALLFLAALKFFGIDTVGALLSLFGIQIGAPHR